VKTDSRTNLFSSVGIGTRGVIFTLRENKRLSLHHALLWRGQHGLVTSITADGTGLMEVKAALSEPVACQKDWDKTPKGCLFPGILTEKYMRHEQLEPLAVVTTIFVLVTPKGIVLAPGSWVEADGKIYMVLTAHELDPWKNEYEIRRREDC
ncbi:MAG: hypothetical protein RRY97_10060, partial [Oscillibacter sp.]